MKRIDRIVLWAGVGAASFGFFYARCNNPYLAGAFTLAFLYCLQRAIDALRGGERAQSRRRKRQDVEDARRYVRALSLTDPERANASIVAALGAEYALKDPKADGDGYLFTAEGKRVFLRILLRHPEAGRADASEIAAARMGMLRVGADHAVLAATCPEGKAPLDEALRSVRVIDSEALSALFAKRPDSIDRSILPQGAKSARSEKLRALGKACLNKLL